MAIPTIVVYSFSDNRNEIRLLDSGRPVSLLGVEMMELRLDTGEVWSSRDYPEAIKWDRSETPVERGRVFLRLGIISAVATREYIADFFVYDPHHEAGIFWGKIRIRGIGGGSSGAYTF